MSVTFIVNIEQSDIKGSHRFGPALRIITVLCFALAIFVRCYHLGVPDYWLDELHSMSNAAGYRDIMESIPYGEMVYDRPNYIDLTPESTWSAVWNTMKYNSHPPTYFIILQTWRRWWGDGESATRSLPAVLSVLSILPIALIFRELNRHRLIPWMVLGLALCFSHIHIGQENRPYSLGLLWVGTSFWLLVRLETYWSNWSRKRKGLESGLYALCIWLAMMTHYFTVFVLLAQVVYTLIRFRGSLLRVWVFAVVIAATAWMAVWGPTFLAQQEFISGQDWLLENNADHFQRTIYRVTDLPIRLLVNHDRFTFRVWRSLLGVGWLSVCCILCWRCRNSSRRRAVAGALLFMLWYFVPLTCITAIDWISDRQLLAHIRYMSVAGPGLVGLIVLAANYAPRFIRWMIPVVLLTAVGFTLSLPTPRNPRGLLAAGWIEERILPDDVMIYDAQGRPSHWIPHFYMLISYYWTGVDHPFVLLRDPPDQHLLEQLQSFPRLIVVSPRIDAIPNPLPQAYRLSMKSSYIEKIGWVYIFTRPANRTEDGE